MFRFLWGECIGMRPRGSSNAGSKRLKKGGGNKNPPRQVGGVGLPRLVPAPDGGKVAHGADVSEVFTAAVAKGRVHKNVVVLVQVELCEEGGEGGEGGTSKKLEEKGEKLFASPSYYPEHQRTSCRTERPWNSSPENCTSGTRLINSDSSSF